MTHDLPPRRPTDHDVEALAVDDGLADLFHELVHSPEAATLDDLAPRRASRSRWPVAVAAAAAVAAAVSAPVFLSQGDDPAAPAGDAVAATTGPSASTGTTSSPRGPASQPAGPSSTPWTGPSSYAALDAAGWMPDPALVSTKSGYSVSIGYARGNETFELEWTLARWYRGVRSSAMQEGQPLSKVEVLGEQADYVAYESGQQMAYLPISGGYGLRIAGTFTSPATFRELLGELQTVDEDGLAEALPDVVVTPDETDDVVAGLLNGAEVPDVFVVPAAAGFNGRFSLAYPIADRIGCAWTVQFVQARRDGNAADQDQAVDALTGSTGWKLLDEIDDPRMFADLARLMRNDASDREVLGRGCGYRSSLSSTSEGAGDGTTLPEALEEISRR